MTRLGVVVLIFLAALVVAILGASASSADSPAIVIILEARESHLRWAEYFRATPGAENRMVRLGDVVGNEAFHRAWVKKYDQVLQELRKRRKIVPYPVYFF